MVSAFGLPPAASDERPIGDALAASNRHDVYLAQGIRRVGALVARGAWGDGGGHPANERTVRLLGGSMPMASGKRQMIEGVTGDSPGEDPGRAANPAGGQGRRLHLPAGNHCDVRPAATQSCLSYDLSNCTSTVLDAKRFALSMFSGVRAGPVGTERMSGATATSPWPSAKRKDVSGRQVSTISREKLREHPSGQDSVREEEDGFPRQHHGWRRAA